MNTSTLPVPRGSASCYRDRHFDRDAMKILPGEFYTTARDEVIVTVLGSCVAACLLDPVSLIGGMNHFMLPLNKGHDPQDVYFSARYGTGAMELLINELLHLGAQRGRLVAKVFGGGRVMKGMSDVGAQNIAFIRTFLLQENIPLWAEDLGGVHPRKVYFFPHTGQVLVKRLQKTHNDTIFTREESYFRTVNEEPAVGDVELFT